MGESTSLREELNFLISNPKEFYHAVMAKSGKGARIEYYGLKNMDYSYRVQMTIH